MSSTITIPTIQFNESMVGANDPNAADTLNRALLGVIAQSAGSPTAFVGFSLIGHTHVVADITNLSTAGYLTVTGGTMTGPIKGKGYQPNINFQALSSGGPVNYTALPTDEIIAFSSISGTCSVTLPLANSANSIIIADILGQLTSVNYINVNVQAGNTGIYPGPAAVPLQYQWGSWQFVSDGASKWSLLGILRNNATTSNPAVGNDNTEGYQPGSLWNNVTLGTLYMCTNAATGAAVWVEIQAGSGSPSGPASGDLGGSYPGPTVSPSAVALNPTTVALTDGATITWATAGARVLNASVTIGASRTLAITGAVSGQCGILAVTQGTGGGFGLTLPGGSKVANAGAGAVTLSAAAGATDILSFYYDGTNYWWTVALNFT